jgi:DMSO/TMAO reductase YedYZ molybdopterin-dependent catalytic subunit
VTERVPPGQVLTKGWPVLHAGSVPYSLTPATWTLRIHGAVDAPFSLDYAQLLAMPQRSQTNDIHCVTSWSKLDMTWEGVEFRRIAERAKVRSEARFVVMECEQGFTTSLPLETLLEDDVLVAHTAAGAPLPAGHGGPVRMLVPRRYFYKSAKWLRGLRFVAEDEPGFWEVRGYSNVADPWRQMRYDVDDVTTIHKMRKRDLFQAITGRP